MVNMELNEGKADSAYLSPQYDVGIMAYNTFVGNFRLKRKI